MVSYEVFIRIPSSCFSFQPHCRHETKCTHSHLAVIVPRGADTERHTQLSLGPSHSSAMISNWRLSHLPPILLFQILSLLFCPYHVGTAGQQCRLTSSSHSQDPSPDNPFPSGGSSPGGNGTNGTTIPEGPPFVYGTDVIRGVNLYVLILFNAVNPMGGLYYAKIPLTRGFCVSGADGLYWR